MTDIIHNAVQNNVNKPIEEMTLEEKITEILVFKRELDAMIGSFQSSGMAKMFMGNVFAPKKG